MCAPPRHRDNPKLKITNFLSLFTLFSPLTFFPLFLLLSLTLSHHISSYSPSLVSLPLLPSLSSTHSLPLLFLSTSFLLPLFPLSHSAELFRSSHVNPPSYHSTSNTASLHTSRQRKAHGSDGIMKSMKLGRGIVTARYQVRRQMRPWGGGGQTTRG